MVTNNRFQRSYVWRLDGLPVISYLHIEETAQR